MPTLSAIETSGRPQVGESTERSSTPDEVRRTSVDSPSPETVRAAVEANPKVVFGSNTVEFSYDDDANRVVVKVRAEDSEEIVRQIPAEDYLKFVSKFREFLGVIFDEVA